MCLFSRRKYLYFPLQCWNFLDLWEDSCVSEDWRLGLIGFFQIHQNVRNLWLSSGEEGDSYPTRTKNILEATVYWIYQANKLALQNILHLIVWCLLIWCSGYCWSPRGLTVLRPYCSVAKSFYWLSSLK